MNFRSNRLDDPALWQAADGLARKATQLSKTDQGLFFRGAWRDVETILDVIEMGGGRVGPPPC